MQIAIDTHGLVTGWGDAISPQAGSTVLTLSPAQTTAFQAVLAQPSAGFTYAAGQFAVIAPEPAPATSVQAGTGTGGGDAAFLPSAMQPSTDARGTVRVTIPAGASPVPNAAGHYQLAVIRFSQPLPQPPVDVMATSPTAGTQALGAIFGDDFAVSGFALYSTAAPVAGRTYRIGYALG